MTNAGIDDKYDYSIVDGDHDDEKDIDGNNSNGRHLDDNGDKDNNRMTTFVISQIVKLHLTKNTKG